MRRWSCFSVLKVDGAVAVQVVFHYRIPLPLRGQNQFNGFAHGAAAARAASAEMGMFAHQIVAVGHADAQADAGEQRQIRQVVAHVADLGVLHLGGVANSLVGFDLLQRVLLKEVDSQILGASSITGEPRPVMMPVLRPA